MNRTDPPSMATWMLEHWTPGVRNDALEGDLLEEFRSGRSAHWYWRQVVAAVVIGCCAEILNRRALLIFAVLWSMMAPAWMFYTDTVEAHSIFMGRIWRIDWPWSTILASSLTLAIDPAFVWAGTLLYLFLHRGVRWNLSLRQFGRGFLRGVTAFVAVSAIILALVLFLSPGHSIDRRTLTLLGELTNFRLWATISRLPFLLSMLYGLWEAASISGDRRIKTLA